MKILTSFPFYTFLLALFFCLHGVAENYGFITFNETLQVFIPVFIVISILFVALFVATKKLHASGLVTFYCSICYLFYEAIKNIFKHIPFLKSYTFLLPFALMLGIILFIIAKNKEKAIPKISFFLNILLLLYCLYDIGLIVLLTKKEKINSLQNINFNYNTVVKKPNVYYLVFDEYAGYKTLSDSLHFKNDALYQFFNKNNFVEIPTNSNYFFTPFSISSTINMQYMPSINGKHIVTAKQIQQRTAEIKNGAVFNIFNSMGYTIKSFSFFDVLKNKNVGGSQFLVGHSRILTNKMFHNQLLKDVGWRFVIGAKKPNIIHQYILNDLPYYNVKIEKGLLQNINNEKTKPQFLYAHFFMPHKPYLIDSIGKIISYEKVFSDKTNLQEDAAYLSYLKYCNKKIMLYAQTIIKKDSNAIIVISSDHGRKDYASTYYKNQAAFNNICFVYPSFLIEKNTVNKYSNVNIFGLVFNNFFNQKLPMLPNKTFYLEDIKQ